MELIHPSLFELHNFKNKNSCSRLQKRYYFLLLIYKVVLLFKLNQYIIFLNTKENISLEYQYKVKLKKLE